MFLVYVIQQSNGRSYWKPAGVAFRNQDGSLNFKLDVLPNTQFQIRPKNGDAKEPEDGRSHA